MLQSDAHQHAAFWRQTNANFFDMCVLEWCKLLADKTGKHYWSKVVTDPAQFEADLLKHLDISRSAYDDEIRLMRDYRNKFVAHLDNLHVMTFPILDTAKAAVWFYHGHVVRHEVEGGELAGIFADSTEKLTRGYQQCSRHAEAVFSQRELGCRGSFST